MATINVFPFISFLFILSNGSRISVSNQTLAVIDDVRMKLLWDIWKREQEKEFKSMDEEALRYFYFEQTVKVVDEHNEKYKRGEESYCLAINKYADLTYLEFHQKMLGFFHTIIDETTTVDEMRRVSLEGTVPDFVDWRRHGWVTSVKDQKFYPSGFAFSAVGALESHHIKRTGITINLSAQELIDCSLNHGIRMGSAFNGLLYAMKYGSITEYDYPYEAMKQPCRARRKTPVFRYRSVKILLKDDEENLKRAVALKGPISVHIRVNNRFRHYQSGIYNDSGCSNGYINHAVLVVGYGTNEWWGDYWIVKNSWGTDWGEDGYIFMARNSLQNYRIASFASYPSVK